MQRPTPGRIYLSPCSYCKVVAWIFFFFFLLKTTINCVEAHHKESKEADFVLFQLGLSTSCLEPQFANLFVAATDNRRKLGCTAATGLFHSVMPFH